MDAVIYFASPRTIWGGKVHAEDVIMRRPAPWRWLARRIAKSVHSQLDPARCGYVVVNAVGEIIEHVEPLLSKAPRPKRGKTFILGS